MGGIITEEDELNVQVTVNGGAVVVTSDDTSVVVIKAVVVVVIGVDVVVGEL